MLALLMARPALRFAIPIRWKPNPATVHHPGSDLADAKPPHLSARGLVDELAAPARRGPFFHRFLPFFAHSSKVSRLFCFSHAASAF
jgi:hypothetical protein